MNTIEEVNNYYNEVNELDSFDSIHIYDTGRRCVEDNSGYHCARHMEVVAYNSETRQRASLGKHDGISCFTLVSLSKVIKVRHMQIFEDGSFYIGFSEPHRVSGYYQNLQIETI